MGFLRRWLDRFRPTPRPTPPPGFGDGPLPETILAGLLMAHNLERSGVVVRPLKLDMRLVNAAQKHADWMAFNRVISHTGAGGSTVGERVEAVGFVWATVGENVAATGLDRSVDAVMSAWVNSPGHLANIVRGTFTRVGFGQHDGYWCAVFASTMMEGAGDFSAVIHGGHAV